MDRISESGANYICSLWQDTFAKYLGREKDIAKMLRDKDFSEDERKVFLAFMEFGFYAGLGHAEASIRAHNIYDSGRNYGQMKTKLETGKWQYELDQIELKEWEDSQKTSTDTETH